MTSMLRLVSAGPGRRDTPTASEVCLTLESAMWGKDIVGEHELAELFKSLRLGERIDFVHMLERSESDTRYAFQIRVTAGEGHVQSLSGRVSSVVRSAFSGLHFRSGGELPVTPLPFATRFSPAGVRIVQRADRSVLDSWPLPQSFPQRFFGTPLCQPTDLPATIETCIRIHAFSLEPKACESLHATLRRLEAGGLDAFHPDSPLTAFASSPELGRACIPLIQHWLRHPRGWAMDCIVRGNERLGPVARQLIPAELFGSHAFDESTGLADHFLGAHEQHGLHRAIAVAQGMPPIAPAAAALRQLGVPRHFSSPAMTPPRTGSLIGDTACGKNSSPVGIPFESRSKHVGLFGASGSGKSSLMMRMIAADIADPHRRCGVGVIDPHGSLSDRILEMIPAERVADVVLVDTADLSATACINPLEGLKGDPVAAGFVVNEIISLIDMLFETRDSSGPMTRSNIRNLLLLTTGVGDREPSLLDALLALEDSKYTEYLLDHCKDRNVVDYWRKFMRTQSSDNGYAQWGPYIMARLGPFLASPIMKRLLGRPESTVNLSEALAERKIVIFNLNKGLLHETEVQVLGSLVLMKFFSAALARARLPADRRPQFHLYVDEFQTFATDTIPKLFSEARKFGLCLTTANQSLGQLENRWGRTNIAQSVLANTATKFMFRLGPEDIDTLGPYFRPHFDSSEMSSLPDFHSVACISNGSAPLPPFVMRSPAPGLDIPDRADPESVKQASRRKYSLPIATANRELVQLFRLDTASLCGEACAQAGSDNEQKVRSRGPEAARNDALALWRARQAKPSVNADGGASQKREDA